MLLKDKRKNWKMLKKVRHKSKGNVLLWEQAQNLDVMHLKNATNLLIHIV